MHRIVYYIFIMMSRHTGIYEDLFNVVTNQKQRCLSRYQLQTCHHRKREYALCKCLCTVGDENMGFGIGGERVHGRRFEARLRDVSLGILIFVVCFTRAPSRPVLYAQLTFHASPLEKSRVRGFIVINDLKWHTNAQGVI